ncbi:MAG TPA: prepilin peptidase [Sphingomicrobium sp.]|nr:prepilin peptidase [Sphingomicrobium sp.]
MNLLATAPQWLLVALLVLLLLAALEDGWRLTINNILSAAVALGAFLAVALDGPIVGLWQNLLLFAAVLVVGTVLFARKAMGGGDVKLLAASVLWCDLSTGWKLLVAISIAGGLEALLVLMLRRYPWPESVYSQVALLRWGVGIPYGIAIACGMALMIWWLRW